MVIHSGDSMNALVQGTKYEESLSGKRFPLAYCKYGGLGFLNNYVLDSHFSDKGHEMRLIRTLLDSRDLPDIGTPKGLGVDENTALVISNPLSKPVGKVCLYRVAFDLEVSFVKLSFFFQVITAEVSLSGVFFVDVSTVPAESSSKATYEKIPFSFFTVNDTIDLTSGKQLHFFRDKVENSLKW